MYSFVSSNDFDHKTVYVSDWTSPDDAAVHYGHPMAPLEPVYMFDDLYERFRTEIEHAHLTGTSYQTTPLNVGRFYQNSLTSSYYYLRLTVSSSGTITIQRAITSNPNSSSTSWSTVSTCTKEQYQSVARQYYNGQIYFIRQRSYSRSTGELYESASFNYYAGRQALYTGTWQSPSSSYQYGLMVYSFTGNYSSPGDVPIMGLDQLGLPYTDTNAKMNQPEILIEGAGSWSTNPTYNTMVVSFDGSYDPDPTPPGPGPGPGDTDPNYDPNIEPGDNPNPRPGGHVRDYDPVPIPPKPSVTAVGAGFTTLYRPSAAILRLLAGELYSDNTIQIISNFFSDPYDMIAGLSIVPFMPTVSGRAKHRIGLFESDIAMDVISDQFVDINCGDVYIEPYYNSFLDHSPYTRLLVWLPYIGYQEIDPDEFMGQNLNITYRCDCLSGACTAFVNTGVVGELGPQIPRVLAQFSGNCSVQIPTAAASYDNMISSAINILTTAVSAGVGQVSAAASMAAMDSHDANQEDMDAVHAKAAVSGGQSLIGCAGDVVRAMKPTVTRNGTPGSTAGYMGIQKPYIIRIVPRSSIPDDEAFMKIKGYPSNRTGTLSDYSGFCQVEDIQLNNVPATIGEINEIYDLLRGGVIL